MKALSFLFLFGLILTVVSCKKDEQNHAPVITAIQVNPSSVNANGVVSVTVLATDADGDGLTYSYSVSGGAISGLGPNVSWTAPAIAGANSINVTVSDGKGGQVSGNGSLNVLPAVTQITGTARFPAGVSGDLSNAKVSIYTSRDNWVNNQPIKFGSVTGNGANVSFTLTNVNPGNYYLDVWKDIDNSGTWTFGDYVGWYGSGGLGSPALTEFQISQGQTFNCTVDMYIIQ
ncbi:MAG: Ig-like domain-containing protein [Saprospiraceae bacterium]